MADFGREPEPDWNELDDKGKIERLRDEVYSQNRLIREMANYLNKLVSHDHMGGKIVQPINETDYDFYLKTFAHDEIEKNWLY